jgi:predicted ATPase/tetratricopeptide (TPR) repeat protein
MAGQQLLLLLDNLEQILDCTAFIGRLLDRVPGVKVLATSREPLRLRGEQELALAPLALPPEGSAQDALSLSAYAAVQLFVDRAVAVRADFAVTNDNAPAVAGICQRLDGHPLAIELAAARVRMMTPQALLPRLDQALSVLTGGGRDLPGRHQTLRATIAWSYDLLELSERLLLDRVSVFAGPASFDLIEAVCGQDLDVFSALASLVEKSLVRTSLSGDGEDRYGLLVSIRAYAAEQLDAVGGTEALQGRHAELVVAQAALQSPYTMVEVLRQHRRVAELYDELGLAWVHELGVGDAVSIRSFPVVWFEQVFDRTHDSSGLDAVLACSNEPSLDLAFALKARLDMDWSAGLTATSELVSSRLREVADALDHPEARLLVLAEFAGLEGRSGDQMRELITQMDILLEQVSVDSPHSQEGMRLRRDNIATFVLMFIDPAVAEAAALNCHQGDPGDGASLFNLAAIYLAYGRWQDVLDVTAAAVTRGPVRTEFAWTHNAVATAARALVALGRPQDALDLLAPWSLEVIRRGWQLPLEIDATARAAALLALGRVPEAQEVITNLPRPLTRASAKLMALRLDRLSAGSLDPAQAAAEAAGFDPVMMLTYHLGALVEQALREPSPDTRQALLERILAFNTTLIIPLGYQADLDQLRVEHALTRPAVRSVAAETVL